MKKAIISPLPEDHPARAYGFSYDAHLLTDGYDCGIGHFCETLTDAFEWVKRVSQDATIEKR